MKNLLSTLSDSLIGKVLGAHELFIVEHIHHNKELSWNAKRSSLTVTKQKNRLVNVSRASFFGQMFFGPCFFLVSPQQKSGVFTSEIGFTGRFLAMFVHGAEGEFGRNLGVWKLDKTHREN